MPKEGPPIWVESVLTDEEYKLCSKKFPNTYTNGPNKVQMFDCVFKWRYRMGAGMNPTELKVFNKRVENLATMIKEQKEAEEKAKKK